MNIGRAVVRAAQEHDQAFIRETLERSWGSTTIVVHGQPRDAAALPSLLAEIEGEPVGLLTYDSSPQSGWEVVTLDSARSRAGIGTALLDALAKLARAHTSRLWLVTTNDKVDALRFYQRRGWDLVAIHRGAVTAARALKPSIPFVGEHGIPIRHELQLELSLGPTPDD